MKLMQLNIWGGKLLRQITALIEAEQPDIICLQEVFSGNGQLLYVPEPYFSSLEVISALPGYKHVFFAPACDLTLKEHKLSFGNAIISKLPLKTPTTTFVAGKYVPTLHITERFPNARNLQTAEVILGDGRKLTIANHHGFWQPDPIGNAETVAAMQRVADVLRAVDGPLILSGDLNVIAEAPAMRVFDNFLEDLTATHGITDTLSQLGKVRNVPCDHILVSPSVAVNNYRVSDALVSDHCALLLDFEV